jgi:methyl-accepting chemotaxis protein
VKIVDSRTEDLKVVVDVAVDAIGCMSKISDISRGLSDVNSRTQALAAATQEMVASVAEIANSSDSAASDADAARQIADTGRQSADRAVATVHTIAETVRSAAEKVDRLSDASARIGTILNTIEAIAKQTNLLALNATIEAARAGEAGKGFAVVAGEVKSLANQTAKATVDIRQLIESLRTEISAIVSTMETSAAAVEEGEKVIAETGEQITTIAQRATNVTHRMHEIAGILGQQQAAADEIAQGVGTIATLSAENDSEIQQILGSLDHTFGMLTNQLKSYEDCTSDQAILTFGRSDHVAFMKRVLDGILGRSMLHSHDLPDHRGCRLGKWYLSAKDGSVGRLPSFSRLDAPHAKVHDHGKRSLDLKERGDLDGALKEAKLMEAASREVLDILAVLVREAE